MNTPNRERIKSVVDRIGLAEVLLLVIVAGIIIAWGIFIPQSAVRGAAQSHTTNNFQVADTRLIGVVRDMGTNQAISNATVMVTDSITHVYSTITNASGWYTFTDTITNPLAAGVARITASKIGYQTRTITTTLLAGEDNRQDIQLATADLVVTKRDGRSTVFPGQAITYTIAITNVGSLSAAGLVITDVLPTSLTYLSDSSGVTPSIPTAGTYVWRLPSTLGTNSRTSFSLRVRVANALSSPTAEIRNTVRVGTSSPEANLSNNAAEDIDTATGTANLGITLAVTPSQVRTAQNATYTIRVTNSGNALATDIVIEDTFSTYLDLISTTTSKGTATTNNTTRKITVDISVLSEGETATVTVVGRVNSSATFNTTVTNLASVRYRYGGSTITRTSNSASFQLLVSSTLPVTGGVELQAEVQKGIAGFSLPVLISGLILGILGIFAIAYGIYTRPRLTEWSGWYIKMGVIFTLTAVTLGLAFVWLTNFNPQAYSAGLLMVDKADLTKLVYLPVPEEGPVWPSNSPTEEFQTLPDYPIPEPEIDAAQGSPESNDLTPIKRIIIPALGVDTVVKYVPFDGLTWLVSGLRQEVAWMGDTSWPGLEGNTALAGHVSLWDGSDGPFRHIHKLAPMDEIVVHTDENIYTYRVRESLVVAEADLSILEPVAGKQLTLITCTGWNPEVSLYLERLAVIAELAEVTPFEQVISGQ